MRWTGLTSCRADFRTPGSGLYAQVEKWGLPCKESVFDLSYFNKKSPDAFYRIANDMCVPPRLKLLGIVP